MIRIRLSRYSSVYFSGFQSAARLLTSAFAMSSSALRMPLLAGKPSGLGSASSSANRIIDNTMAWSITSTAARCCASRRMNLAIPIRPDSRSASRSSA